MPCAVSSRSRTESSAFRAWPLADADPRHHAVALRLDEDLAVLALLRPDLLPEEVVGAQEPLAVPAVLEDRLLHPRRVLAGGTRLVGEAHRLGERRVVGGHVDEEAGDEHRLRGATGAVPGRLERLARGVREAVEVQAIVPVRAADEGQAVRAQVVEDVVERALQVLEQGRRVLRVVVEGDRFLQDAEVAGLLDVGGGAGDEPQRVVVEARADGVVPPLRERLVLVVGAPVRLLRRRDVEDALFRARGDQVHEAQQVLVRVAEAHAAADPGLEVGGRARHVEGHHALVGVPDVDHAVEALVSRFHRVLREHLRPVVAECLEGGVRLRRRLEARQQLPSAGLVHDPGPLPLLRDRVLDVAEDEDEGLLLARSQIHGQLVRADRRPAAGHGVARLPLRHDLGLPEAVPEAEEALAVGVEAGHFRVHRVDGVVVAALAVLGLVVDRRAVDLHLADRQVPLVVVLVVRGVPEAELDEREEPDALRGLRGVLQGDPVHLGGRPERDEVEDLGPDPLPLAR